MNYNINLANFNAFLAMIFIAKASELVFWRPIFVEFHRRYSYTVPSFFITCSLRHVRDNAEELWVL